jgi:hypothetical protein
MAKIPGFEGNIGGEDHDGRRRRGRDGDLNGNRLFATGFDRQAGRSWFDFEAFGSVKSYRLVMRGW